VRNGKGGLGCLSPGVLGKTIGLLRQQALRTIENPRFDEFVMMCTIVNCIFLAFDNPKAAATPLFQAVVCTSTIPTYFWVICSLNTSNALRPKSVLQQFSLLSFFSNALRKFNGRVFRRYP
jgi:hypothetical protein